MRRAGLRRFDVALAVGVAAIGQLDVWAPILRSGPRLGPPAALAITLLLASAALLWRRRWPLAVVAAVNAVLSVQFLVFGASDVLGNFLPPLLAFYAAGRYGTRSAFWAALAITAAGTAVHEWRDPQFSFEGRTMVFWAILLAGGVVGRLFSSGAGELAAIRRHAERVESEGEERARASAADERARIARELHDLVGHGISLVVLQVVAARASLEQGRIDATQDRLARLEATARGTLAEMRRLVSVAGDGEASLAPQPGIAEIDALVEQVRAGGVSVELEKLGALETGSGVGLAAYRLVQEALTNVIKHAGPAPARVVVAQEGQTLTVEVVDGGRGAAGDLATGRGLAGMRERMALYGGTLEAGPRPEGGFGVRACFPLDAEAQ